METSSRFARVLAYQSFGFLTVITLCWLNSLLGLPSLIFEGRLQMSDIHGPVLQMLLILAVWLLVGASTRRVLEKLRQLETFLRVCSWCRRIDFDGKWMALEEFLRHGFETPTTQGLCSDCLLKIGLRRTKQDSNEKGVKGEVPPATAGLTRLV